MRTTVEVDGQLVREAQAILGARTEEETVELALRELIVRYQRLGILELRGLVRWEGDLDRSRRST